MKKFKNQIIKVLTIVAAILVTFTAMPVRAEDTHGPLLQDYEDATAISKFTYFGFNKNTVQTDMPTSASAGVLAETDAPKSYTVKYPNSLDYFGQKLSVQVDVTFDGANEYGFNRTGEKTSMWVGTTETEERKKNSVWIKAFGADFSVTVTVYEDEDFTKKFNDFVGAISFVDPDEANYGFTTSGYHIYYDNKDSLGSKYYVDEGGLDRVSWGNILDAEIGVALDHEPSFTYEINGHGDWIYLPDFIIVEAPYKVEYYYQNNDGTYPDEPESTSELRYSNIYENPKAKVNDDDKKSQKEGYALDENMDEEWELEYKTDGTTVLKVYFRPAYTIKYDGNGGTLPEGKEMPDDVYHADEDETMPSKEEWLYEREGYDFIGFKLENKGDLEEGSVDYRDVLIEEEDREITLYAQWDPWKYTIKYDPNGGKGEMPDHIYDYEDPTMNSDPNKFTRGGYTFVGFTYTDEEGNVTLYTSINDFRKILTDLGKNSEITLVAQWKRIPPTPTPTYTLPVTGD